MVDEAEKWTFQRIAIGRQHVLTDAVVRRLDQEQRHIASAADLLHSIVQYPFSVAKGARARRPVKGARENEEDRGDEDQRIEKVESELARQTSAYRIGTVPEPDEEELERLNDRDALVRMPNLRPTRVVQPTSGGQTSLLGISGSAMARVPVSDASILEPLLDGAIARLDRLLSDLNTLNGASFLPIWRAEMVQLGYQWEQETTSLYRTYCKIKRRAVWAEDLALACAILACPMTYGLPRSARQLLTREPPVQAFRDDLFVMFRHSLPILVPRINGLR